MFFYPALCSYYLYICIVLFGHLLYTFSLFTRPENPFGYIKGIKTRAGESDIDYWTIDSQTRTSRAISLRYAIFLNEHWSEEKGVSRLRNGFHYQVCEKKVEDRKAELGRD